MSNTFLKIHPADNVFVALTDLKAGEKISYEGKSLVLKDDVNAKHKFAENDLAPEDELNRILWYVAKGPDVPYPTPIHRAIITAPPRADRLE